MKVVTRKFVRIRTENYWQPEIIWLDQEHIENILVRKVIIGTIKYGAEYYVPEFTDGELNSLISKNKPMKEILQRLSALGYVFFDEIRNGIESDVILTKRGREHQEKLGIYEVVPGTWRKYIGDYKNMSMYNW